MADEYVEVTVKILAKDAEKFKLNTTDKTIVAAMTGCAKHKHHVLVTGELDNEGNVPVDMRCVCKSFDHIVEDAARALIDNPLAELLEKLQAMGAKVMHLDAEDRKYEN